MNDSPLLLNVIIAFPVGVALACWHLALLRQQCLRLLSHPYSARDIAIHSLLRLASLLLLFFVVARYLEGIQMLMLVCGYFIGRLSLMKLFLPKVPVH